MRRIVAFGIASLGVIAVGLLVFWGVGGFRALGLDTSGSVALMLGILFTSALGVTLMALIFYSHQSDADEDAYRATGGEREPPTDRRN